MDSDTMPSPDGDPGDGRSAASLVRQLARNWARTGTQPMSPSATLRAVADHLERGADEAAWIVRASKQARNASAWPRWFADARRRSRKPLLYLLRSKDVAGLATAIAESADRGIFCNDAVAPPSRFSQGVHPALPLWLASRFHGIPYDPASGHEMLAILQSALEACDMGGQPGLFYLSMHGDPAVDAPLSTGDAADAFQGMYRVSAITAADISARVRLLGAGRALADVRAAARLLASEWEVGCEVWSCPSFTRLARDADAVDDWNMLHPLSSRRRSHIQRCLQDGDAPVIAVTGYPSSIARQIHSCVNARFVALGSDSRAAASGVADPHWIVAIALRALADDGRVDAGRVEEALRRYGLR